MSPQEFTEIVENYKDALFRIAFHRCENRADAEDAVQNAFIKLYKNKGDFNSSEHLKAWLIKVTINECRKIFRNPFTKAFLHGTELENCEMPIFDNIEQSELFDAVRRLSENYRVVLHLYYYEDYSTKEISQMLGISESNVQTRLMRARKALKKALGGYDNDDNNAKDNKSEKGE